MFFYVDPAILKDPSLDGVKSISLSYTFFRTGDNPAGVQGGGSSFDVQAAMAARQKQLDDMKAQTPELFGLQSDGAAAVTSSSSESALASPSNGTNGSANSSAGSVGGDVGSRREEIAKWTAETAAKMGVKLPPQR